MKHTDTLSLVEFHAYVDSELADDQYEEIEKRLVDSPETIINLQNCLLINERLQQCFGGPDLLSEDELETDDQEIDEFEFIEHTELIAPADNIEYIPIEPALSSLTDQDMDNAENSALDSFAELDSLALHEPTHVPLEMEPDTILPAEILDASLLPELEVAELHAPSLDVEVPELGFTSTDIPELEVSTTVDFPELGAHAEIEEPVTQRPPVLLNSAAYPEPEPQEHSPEEDIDVDDFLKGINETHMVDNHLTAMTQASLSKDIFASPESPSRFFAPIKLALIRLLTKIKGSSKSHQHTQALENKMDANIQDFEIDINEAIESTPKFRFWRFRVQHAADEALESVKEQLEPMAPTVSPWLRKVNAITFAINSELRKIPIFDKILNQSYWILGGLIVGAFLGAWAFSAENGINQQEREQLAIDTHLYFLEQGANVADGGTDDFEKNMIWLKKRWGKRVTNIDVSITSKFRRKGATLLPTRKGYASVQIFENFSSERVTVYVSRLDNGTENTRVRCHISKKVDGICSWNHNSLNYVVLGNLSLSRVRHFSSSITTKL